MHRNPLQDSKRQLLKSKRRLAAWTSSLRSHPTCKVFPTQLLQPLLKGLEHQKLSPWCKKGTFPKAGAEEGCLEKVQSKGGRKRSSRKKEKNRVMLG